MHPRYAVTPARKPLGAFDAWTSALNIGKPESRDLMSAVFVSVRNGKVFYQIGAGCAFDAAYTCVNDDGDKEYQLLDTGKFKKLN